MSVREALRDGLKALAAARTPSPQLVAELLLAHVLASSRGDLHARHDQQLSPEAARQYSDLISRRISGIPTQYLTGRQEFWGLDIEVTPDVLIPRPETEHIVETVLDLARRQSPLRETALRIVDVGAGSGCIALALASELSQSRIAALDISAAALRVARKNAARLVLAGRIEFRESDLLRCFLDEGRRDFFDFVVSNPPYVGRGELDSVEREVKEFEPRLAWGGLEDGEEIYRRLFPEAFTLLKPGGYVVVEIGYGMRDAVTGLLGAGWEGVEARPDLRGIPRVVTARKSI
ncbi:MAG: peptide chain release factor N(5)-glutamine methyltransferase [Terriglobia bacterium]